MPEVRQPDDHTGAEVIRAAATYINDSLTVVRNGRISTPGGLCGVAVKRADGYELTLISHGDSFEIIHGRESMTVFNIPAKLILHITFWLVWNWWILGTWCGLKSWLWRKTFKLRQTQGKRA